MTNQEGMAEPPLWEPTLGPVEQEFAYEKESSHRLSKICGAIAVGAAVFIGGGIAGASLTPTHVELGPHSAEVNLTFDSAATIDLGVLDQGILPVDTPLGMGVNVEVKGAPVPDGHEGDLTLNADDLESYISRFGSIEQDVEQARADLVRHGIRSGLWALAGSTITIGAVYALLGKEGWALAGDRLSRAGQNKTARRILVASALVAGCAPAHASAQSPLPNMPDGAIPAGSILDDTPLEGMYVTGRFLPGFLNTIVPKAKEMFEENTAFYDEVIQNAKAAIESNDTLRPHDSQHMVMVYGDLHCNFGMARVLGQLARDMNATMILDPGDGTISGTALDSPCIRTLGNELPKIKKVAVTGNHDSDITEDQYRDAGFTVLNGKTIDVDGLKILGDDDPMRSMIGTPAYQEGGESIVELDDRLADIACEELPDLLLVHNPKAAAESLERGCVNFAISGHTHNERIGSVASADGKSILHLVVNNASGTVSDAPSIGKSDKNGETATVYFLKVSKETGLPTFRQSILIHPDASVTVEQPVQIPPPVSLAANINN